MLGAEEKETEAEMIRAHAGALYLVDLFERMHSELEALRKALTR